MSTWPIPPKPTSCLILITSRRSLFVAPLCALWHSSTPPLHLLPHPHALCLCMAFHTSDIITTTSAPHAPSVLKHSILNAQVSHKMAHHGCIMAMSLSPPSLEGAVHDLATTLAVKGKHPQPKLAHTPCPVDLRCLVQGLT